MYSGTISGERGCDRIPRIALEVAEATSDIEFGFLIVRDGPLREWLETEIDRAGLGDKFCFAKPTLMAEIPSLLSIGSVALTLVPKTGLTYAPRNVNKIVEYFAVGNPVVAMKESNAEEYIQNGVTGIVSNGSDLARTLCNLLTDIAQLRRMSLAARKRAEVSFDCS